MQRFSRFPLRSWLPTALALFLVVAASFGAGKHVKDWFSPPAVSATKLSRLPPLILWAWERPENLDYLDSSRVSVAFLAKTVYLRGARAVVRPRLQLLAIPKAAPLIAVARIESDRSERPTLVRAQLSEAALAISVLSQLPGVVAVQVDYDATTSERLFYRNLLFELRRLLPDSTGLTITALASWCKGDNWLDDLPIDEAVPMLFRMGVERNQILSQLAAGETFTSNKCQTSLGLSTDEPVTQLRSGQRHYVFNPKVWSPASVDALLRTYENQQQAP